MSNSWFGPLDPAPDAGWEEHPPRKGFFTDTSVCIGCKACEVACKTWNEVPDDGFELLGSSYDNTGALGASTWRHVAFIEQSKPLGSQQPGIETSAVGGPVTDLLNEQSGSALQGAREKLGTDVSAVDLGMPSFELPGGRDETGARTDFRWLMSSDVCKHCTHAGCLDVCPTGSLFRTEFGTVVVQDEICNGCGYCVPACPYGVIDRRVGDKNKTPKVGVAQKCTLCYDRIGEGLTPACAKACPTESIQFGDVDELRERAEKRLAQLQGAGVEDARLYGNDPNDGVGGTGAFFLLLDEPEVYGFPPDPVVPTRDLPVMWRKAALAGLTMLAGAVAAFGAGR
jgi:formate dehydrogenase iron-sulfur subunit